MAAAIAGRNVMNQGFSLDNITENFTASQGFGWLQTVGLWGAK